MSSHWLLASMVSDEKLALILIGNHLYIMTHFALDTLNIFSLSLARVNINVYEGRSEGISLWVHPILSLLSF